MVDQVAVKLFLVEREGGKQVSKLDLGNTQAGLGKAKKAGKFRKGLDDVVNADLQRRTPSSGASAGAPPAGVSQRR